MWGKPELNAADREVLARWKFQFYPARLQRTLNLLGAWLIAQRILGVGPALASAMLMAHDRERFTVMDVRAFKSIRVLVQAGSLTGSGVDPGRLVQAAQLTSAGTWLAYLRACRVLAETTRQSLRDVDRALYAANGHDTLPTNQ